MRYNLTIETTDSPWVIEEVGAIICDSSTALSWAELAHEFASRPKLIYIQLFVRGALAPMLTITRGVVERYGKGGTLGPSIIDPDRASKIHP